MSGETSRSDMAQLYVVIGIQTRKNFGQQLKVDQHFLMNKAMIILSKVHMTASHWGICKWEPMQVIS
jgi:hypothetical protein